MKSFILRTVTSLLMIWSMGFSNAHAWGRFPGGHHPDYNPHFVHGGGCIGCGVGAAAVAGLVGGAIVGAVIAGSAAPPPTTVVVANPGPPPGTQVAILPPGCASMAVNGAQLYQCGPVWYQPFFGANGVYYTVVPGP